MMDAEVSVAMEDWEAIPSARLSEVCGEARRRAAGFIPSNASVLTTWADMRREEIRRRREADLQTPADTAPDKTPEEKAYIESFFANIRRELGKGLRPMDWVG